MPPRGRSSLRKPPRTSSNRPSGFQRNPSGSPTGPFANRWAISRLTASASNRPRTTRPLSAPRSTAAKSVKVEHLFEAIEPGDGPRVEQPGHLRLPACIHVRLLHRLKGCVEVLTLEVADEEAVVTEKERVVPPAGTSQRVEHLGPDRAVP